MKKPFNPRANITVKGATARSSGTPYLIVKANHNVARIPRITMAGGGSAAQSILAEHNIILIGEEWNQFKEKVLEVRKFPLKPLLEEPGWNADCFAFADGTALQPADSVGKTVVLFRKARGKCRARGTIDGWLKDVAEPIRDQKLMQFCFMLMFASPLLRLIDRIGNYGFELAGPKGVGKSTLQFLATTVVGPALDPSGRNYWISANATAAGLESVMFEHADMPIVIEEMNLFGAGEPDRARVSRLNDLVFRLSDGSVKARYKDHDQKRYRFVYLTSTNEPFQELVGTHRLAVVEAAADRHLTLSLRDRSFGIFDSIPSSYADASAFAESLKRAASDQYGTAIRAFLNGLICAQRRDSNALKVEINTSIADFRRTVGVDTSSGSATRVADAFGLIYAAGKLAKRFGALPSSWKCRRAVSAAYELNRSIVEPLSYRDRIIRTAHDPRTIDLNNGLPSLSDKRLKRVPALLYKPRGGGRELLVTKWSLGRLVVDRSAFFRDPEIRRMLVRDGDHRTVKRRIRADHGLERVYSFKIRKNAGK